MAKLNKKNPVKDWKNIKTKSIICLTKKNKYTEVFMFENILTKENVSFKDLEQICYKMYLLSNRWQFFLS